MRTSVDVGTRFSHGGNCRGYWKLCSQLKGPDYRLCNNEITHAKSVPPHFGMFGDP
jgi:hypothetical protein